MAIDRRSGTKIPKFMNKEATPGARIDAGPYVAIVKNNMDPTRSGRLEVYIPDLGGNEEEKSHWRLVSYASPFFGSTHVKTPTNSNDFTNVSHSYGFWFTPPDIGNQVLVTFAAGDPMRGFWFACIPPGLSHWMVPAIAGAPRFDANSQSEKSKKDADYMKQIKSSDGIPLPVAEFNENAGTGFDWGNFASIDKPVHEPQAKILMNQGLEGDAYRGVVTSSSQRESPSTVFGISTPGRPFETDPADNLDQYKADLAAGDIEPEFFNPDTRKGGHTFVMDDGDYAGDNQLIRFRTAGGHQIMMNDSEEVLYIANKTGNAWMEFTGTGQIHMYAGSGFNLRSEGEINMHSDTNINMHAAGNINMVAGNKINVQSATVNVTGITETKVYGGKVGIGSGGALNLQATTVGSFGAGTNLILSGEQVLLNTTAAPIVTAPPAVPSRALPDTAKDPATQTWKNIPKNLPTTVTTAPTHEPFLRGDASSAKNKVAAPGSTFLTPAATRSNVPGSVGGLPPPGVKVVLRNECKDAIVRKGAVTPAPTGPVSPGIAIAEKSPLTKAVPESFLKKQPEPPGGVGPLSASEVKALLAQIAYTESGFDYSIVEVARGNFLGKYQIGAAVLTDFGYISRNAYAEHKSRAVNYDASWTNKDGVTSKAVFLASHAVQEAVIFRLLQRNYNSLVQNKGILPDDTLCVVAGMLVASHLLGPGSKKGAAEWRQTGGGADANGTTGTAYFNRGRYAVGVLAGDTKLA